MNSLFMAFLSSSSQSREELGKSMQGGSVAGAGGGASDPGGGHLTQRGLGGMQAGGKTGSASVLKLEPSRGAGVVRLGKLPALDLAQGPGGSLASGSMLRRGLA